MAENSGYKKQQSLSFMQLLAELPSFVAVLVSAILSRAMLVYVDLLDSLGNVLRAATVAFLSRKLTRDLRYEYNYGIGKLEAIAALMCNGIVFVGLLTTLSLSVYTLTEPRQPSDLVIAVVGLKVINVSFDTAFFVKQRKLLKTHRTAISETNYAGALAALLFDCITLVSLLMMWLFRDVPIGGYISPVISIFVAIYLMLGCIKRTKRAVSELSDRTLPEEQQLKILNSLTHYYSSYSRFHSLNSHKSGDRIMIDLHLSFDEDTGSRQIVEIKKQMQAELDRQLGNCTVNIIPEEEATSPHSGS